MFSRLFPPLMVFSPVSPITADFSNAPSLLII